MTFGWGYPPGVTGSEPEITGEWPCPKCGGEGGDREERTKCWFCGGSGVAPEEAPACPDCGTETEFLRLDGPRLSPFADDWSGEGSDRNRRMELANESEPDYERVYCPDCGEVKQ